MLVGPARRSRRTSRCSTSTPTSRPSKCTRRWPARSSSSTSRSATRSRSARRTASSKAATARPRSAKPQKPAKRRPPPGEPQRSARPTAPKAPTPQGPQGRGRPHAASAPAPLSDDALGVIPRQPRDALAGPQARRRSRTVHGTGPERPDHRGRRATLRRGGSRRRRGRHRRARRCRDFEQFGPVEREPLTQVRKLDRPADEPGVDRSSRTSPSTTSPTSPSWRRSASRSEGKGVKLTVTAFALKACAIALKQFPTFNSSLDLAGKQLILKKYYPHRRRRRYQGRPARAGHPRRGQEGRRAAGAGADRDGREGAAGKAGHERRHASPSPTSAASAAPASRRSSTGRRSPSWACRAAGWSRSFKDGAVRAAADAAAVAVLRPPRHRRGGRGAVHAQVWRSMLENPWMMVACVSVP